MNKFKIIYDYILGNEESINTKRFEIAWDIHEHFNDILKSIKGELVASIENYLSKELDNNEWEIINTFNDGYWGKNSAGIFIHNKKWTKNQHKITIGIQAERTTFNNLYLCVKYNDKSSYLVPDKFLEKDYWINSKEFYMKLITESEKMELVKYYTTKIQEWKETVTPEIEKDL